MKCQSFVFLLLPGATLGTCIANCQLSPAASVSPGPRTVEVDQSDYQQVLYVSQSTGSDEFGEGSRALPWQTIGRAQADAQDSSETRRTAILVASGVYREPTRRMKPYVDLYGGFRPESWRRDIFEHSTVLDGCKERRILLGANHARLDGFTLRGGFVLGRGAALICESASPTITNNRFIGNRTRKPKAWSPDYLHELANDGAAIFCHDGAEPIIRHNLFAGNRTEIGRGAAIAMHGRCAGEISHCVFLDNATGTEDLDRSSDGGAVSVFEWSSPRIENNVFLGNKSFNSNDGGALFVALWSSPTIERNVFVGNRSMDDGGALFVGGQEHRYDKPKDERPRKEEFLVKISDNIFLGNENGRHNSGGMRLTMQARAKLWNNIMARDARLYVQDSEVEIIDNTILEDTILREMPQDAVTNFLANNLFWGRLETGKKRRQKSADGTGAKLPEIVGEEPRFVDEEQVWEITDSTYFPLHHVTEVQINATDFEENALANRAVQLENRWAVIKSNRGSRVTVWGDATQSSKLAVLPSFQVHPDCTPTGETAP